MGTRKTGLLTVVVFVVLVCTLVIVLSPGSKETTTGIVLRDDQGDSLSLLHLDEGLISQSSGGPTSQQSFSQSQHGQSQQGQISEELEHKIGVVETSLNRTGLILDTVQGDVIQVNKGTKEISMEMDGIRQKISVYDNSLQLRASPVV